MNNPAAPTATPTATTPFGATPLPAAGAPPVQQPADAAPALAGAGLDVSRVRAITLDLDDTLWPIGPTIEGAEAALHGWLAQHAPASAALSRAPGVWLALRQQTLAERPGLAHDLGALRRESIGRLLHRAGEDAGLAEAAYGVFFAARQRVAFFDDALPALAFLSQRYPVVALSNGNADVHRIGIGAHFRAAVSARDCGVGKPDPRIFMTAARAAGCAPEAVLHVGDDAQLDGVGALHAGMQLAWLNRSGEPWGHAPLRPHITLDSLHTLCEALA